MMKKINENELPMNWGLNC